MHCPGWRWTCLLRMPEQKVQRHTRAQGAERRKHRQWTSTECAFESGHKSCSQILFMDHLAGKAGTKHPTKVPIGSSSTNATKILLPLAVHLEERLTVSQSVPEPASRQSVRYTQFGFFVSGRCGPKQQGGPALQPKPGRVVKQPTGTRWSAVRTPVWPLWRRRRRRR